MSILSQHLQAALGLARNNAGRKDTNRVLLQPEGSTALRVVCADDTTETEVRIPGTIESSFAIARQFNDLVQTLAADVNVKLTPTDKATAKVQTGKSRFTLPITPAADFPRLKAEPQEKTVMFRVRAANLTGALSSASNGLGKPDPAKPFSSGMLLKVTPKGLFLVGTNGYKLVAVGLSCTSEGQAMEGVVPEMGFNQIERLAAAAKGDDAEVSFVLGARQVQASCGEATVRSRLIGCAFPDYERITAMADAHTVKVSKAALLAVLKRVGLFVPEAMPYVVLKLEDSKLTCTVKNEQGDCTESLQMDGTSMAAEVKLNINYLASVLDAMPADAVNLDFGPRMTRIRGTGQAHNAMGMVAYALS